MSNEEQSMEAPPPGAPSFRLDDVFSNIERIIREETSAEGDSLKVLVPNESSKVTD